MWLGWEWSTTHENIPRSSTWDIMMTSSGEDTVTRTLNAVNLHINMVNKYTQSMSSVCVDIYTCI